MPFFDEKNVIWIVSSEKWKTTNLVMNLDGNMTMTVFGECRNNDGNELTVIEFMWRYSGRLIGIGIDLTLTVTRDESSYRTTVDCSEASQTSTWKVASIILLTVKRVCRYDTYL